MSSDDSLGLAAVNRGFLTPSQLMEAQAERVRTGHAPIPLEQVLLEKGWLTISQITDLTGRCPRCGDMVSRSRGDTVVRHRCTPSISSTDKTLTPASTANTAALHSPPTHASPLADSYADTPKSGISGVFANRYEILLEVGAGGMGRVYKARDRKLDRVVALKKFTGDGQSPEAIERFIREARTAARLAHPSIVQVHDIDVFQGSWYLTMDFIMGRSLLQTIDRRTRGRREMVEIVQQCADALHYAHEQKVIHRDIKPSNILVDEAGRPHVADFGLAKEVTQASTANPITVSGALIGTPHYMSPEQAAGHVEVVDARSDVYSLGATLYHVLTGRPPVKATALVDVLNEVIHAEPVAPSLIDPSVPRDLDTITFKAMSKIPEQRYATAKEFAGDVGRFLRGEAIQARPPSMGERVARRLKKNKVLSAVVAVAVVALFGVAAYGLRQYTLRVDEETRRRDDKERRALAMPIIQGAVDRLAQIEKEIALVEGSLAGTRSKVEAVIREADEAIKLDPDSAHARLVRGRAFILLGRFADAVAEFGRAIDLNPNLAQARYARARLYLDLHFMPVSIPRIAYFDYFKISSAFPRPTDSKWLTLATADFHALRVMPNVDPEKVLFLESFQLFFKEDFEACRLKMEDYLRISPADPPAHFLAGQASFHLSRWKQAIESFDQVLKMNPYHVPARLYRALGWQIQGNFGKAIADYGSLRKMDLDAIGPEYPMSREQLQAVTWLAEGLSRYLTSTFSPLIDIKQRQAGWENILKVVDKSIELDPDNYLAFYFRARVLLLLDRNDEAVAAADASIKIHPGFANTHHARGGANYNRKPRTPESMQRSEEDFTRALAIYPGYHASLALRSAVRWGLNKPDEAASDAIDAIKAMPDGADADLACNILRYASAKVTDVAGLRRQLIEAEPSYAKSKRLWVLKGVEAVLNYRLGDNAAAFKAAILACTERPKENDIATVLVDTTRNYVQQDEKTVLQAAADAPPAVRKQILLGVARVKYDVARDFAACERTIDEALKLDDAFANGYLWRGHTRRKLKKWDGALADYEKVCELVPSMKTNLKATMDAVRKQIEDP